MKKKKLEHKKRQIITNFVITIKRGFEEKCSSSTMKMFFKSYDARENANVRALETPQHEMFDSIQSLFIEVKRDNEYSILLKEKNFLAEEIRMNKEKLSMMEKKMSMMEKNISMMEENLFCIQLSIEDGQEFAMQDFLDKLLEFIYVAVGKEHLSREEKETWLKSSSAEKFVVDNQNQCWND